MSIKSFCGMAFFSLISFASTVLAGEDGQAIAEKETIALVNKAKAYIDKQGKDKALSFFNKNNQPIFAIALSGKILASLIHPETIGTNQINYQDPPGVFVVQEEINKAKAGGGWLPGRFRKNHITKQNACRRLYVLPMKGNYFIGSWYYYAPNKKGACWL